MKTSFNPNAKKHKANHCGYRQKPTQAQVKSNLDFWSYLKDSPCDNFFPSTSQPIFSQLKLNL